jgi:hypothetical protein
VHSSVDSVFEYRTAFQRKIEKFMRNTYLAHDVDVSSFAEQKMHNCRMPLASCMVQRSVAVLTCGVLFDQNAFKSQREVMWNGSGPTSQHPFIE